MVALVTGSAGFVGRHMVRELRKNDFQVDELDVNTHHGDRIDVRNIKHLEEFNKYQYDIVVHAAAHVGGRQDIESRGAYIMANNLQLDAAMFQWAMEAHPRHFVYLSSSAAYPISLQRARDALYDTIGKSDLRLLHEDDIDLLHPELADATYGQVKLVGERMAHEYATEAATWGGRVHVVRPFSGYGSDQDSTYPFGAFIDRALHKEDPFYVWGDGNQIRDFIHIDDICAAIMKIRRDITSPVNLCNGTGYTMLQLAHMVCDAAGYTPLVVTDPTKPSGVFNRIGDPARMNGFYIPRVSLVRGIERALDERYKLQPWQ